MMYLHVDPTALHLNLGLAGIGGDNLDAAGRLSLEPDTRHRLRRRNRRSHPGRESTHNGSGLGPVNGVGW